MVVNAYMTQESDKNFPEVVLMDVNASAGTYYRPFTGTLENGVYTELSTDSSWQEGSWTENLSGGYDLSCKAGTRNYRYLGTALVYTDKFIPKFNYKQDYADGTGKHYIIRTGEYGPGESYAQSLNPNSPIYTGDGTDQTQNDAYQVPYIDFTSLMELGHIITYNSETGQVKATLEGLGVNEPIDLDVTEVKSTIIK